MCALKVQEGKYIVIEGLDGSGKGTQIARLKALQNNFVFVREPGGTPYGEEMRGVLNRHVLGPEGNFFAMLSIRAEVRAKIIEPALREGKNVISDRSDTSTCAYQIFGQQARHLENLFWTLRHTLQPTPSVYIFLDLDPEIAVKRLMSAESGSKRDDVTLSHFDTEVVDFHARVREGFHYFADYVNGDGAVCEFVDASLSEDDVHNAIAVILKKHITF